MSPLTIGVIGIVILLLGLAFRFPVAWICGLVGIAGITFLTDFSIGSSLLATVPFSTVASYLLSTIPMFVLMGQFLYHSGISALLFKACDAWLGGLRGGVGLTTLVASAGLAAVSGSSVANAAAMGTIAWPEMKKLRYNAGFSAGIIAAGGTLGILIPPSTGFIIIGSLTEVSIGRLFIAGLFPGIMLTLIMMGIVELRIARSPSIAPKGDRKGLTLREKWKATVGIIPVLIIFVIVIGGIYGGFFTPTEAGGVGAFLSFMTLVVTRRLSKEIVWSCLRDTVRTTTMIFAIIFGAMVFGYFLALTQLPTKLALFTANLPIPNLAVLGMIMLIFAILGCFMDAAALVIILLPIFFPICLAMNFDPIWFGVLVVMVVEMGLITPPIGMNCYVLSGVMPDVPLWTIFRGIGPMLIAQAIGIAVLMLFPQIATWLPSTMMGG